MQLTRKQARLISEKITNQQIQDMFNKAKSSINDWRVPSIGNKGITKGTAWNVLAKGFDVESEYHHLAKLNMIREFGEYLPYNLKSLGNRDKIPKPTKKPIHQDPEF